MQKNNEKKETKLILRLERSDGVFVEKEIVGKGKIAFVLEEAGILTNDFHALLRST